MGLKWKFAKTNSEKKEKICGSLKGFVSFRPDGSGSGGRASSYIPNMVKAPFWLGVQIHDTFHPLLVTLDMYLSLQFL